MSKPLSICILTSQYFGWGVYGGFGSMARKLAESLAAAGHATSIIVPRRRGQNPVEIINGVNVRSFSPLNVAEAESLIRTSDAEIFHSQDPTLLTWMARRIHPDRRHIVTCRDPRSTADWFTEFRYATAARRIMTPFNYVTEHGPIVMYGVRRAHAVYTPALFLREKVRRMYRLRTLPGFLPNLIDVPPNPPTKADVPTFTFLARWDRRKRPELFLELAGRFPQFRFIAVGHGTASAESRYAESLRRKYSNIPNLELTGHIDRFHDGARLGDILDRTWALVNTSAREGLPLTFLEAAAHGCAIVSSVDPDNFASRFGVLARRDDYARAIETLMDSAPLEKGLAGREHVLRVYESRAALKAHITEYRSLLQ